MSVSLCEVCNTPAVASINGHGMCGNADHIRQVVASTMENVRGVIEHVRAKAARGEPPDDDVRPDL